MTSKFLAGLHHHLFAPLPEEDGAMRESPILFSAEMVKAILDGRKSQTRRVIVPQPTTIYPASEQGWFGFSADGQLINCPYGGPGDRLWLQEAYRITAFDRNDSRHKVSGYYLADSSTFRDIPLTAEEWAKLCKRNFPMRASPGRFLYRSLSRITLEVAEVRVERLQEISRGDAIAEGIEPGLFGQYKAPGFALGREPVGAFQALWESINGKRPGCSWGDNPWVWVVSFRVQREVRGRP